MTVIATCLLAKDKTKTTIVAVLGLSLAVSSTYLVTSMLKIYIGKLRPDFLARCKPDVQRSSVWSVICTGNEDIIIAGRKSMPSGHTSSINISYLTKSIICWVWIRQLTFSRAVWTLRPKRVHFQVFSVSHAMACGCIDRDIQNKGL